MKKYSPPRIVGDYFEIKIAETFDLVRIDIARDGNIPDLRARDGSFYMECKASSVDRTHGGVVKGKQLVRFLEEINKRRFYAFAYHVVTENMQENYPTARRLRNQFSRTSHQVQYFVFPFSIVLAFYLLKPKSYKDLARKEPFVKLSYKQAQLIYSLDEEFLRLGLDPREYKQKELHERVHLLTRQGNLEDRLVNSFHPEEV